MPIVINDSDKILILAAHPEDLAIACGGFICKYRKQIDLLCIKCIPSNLPENNGSESDNNEFRAAAELAHVNKFYTETFTDTVLVSGDAEAVCKNINSYLNIKDYDIVLVPHSGETAPKHRFLYESLLKTLIENYGCKDDLQILRYELWNPIKEANYYEDITDFVNDKKGLILSYRSNSGGEYAERILSMNRFRTFTSYLSSEATHVEAYFADNLGAFLSKPDIINEETDKDFRNPETEAFLVQNNAQEKINRLSSKYQGKKIIVYGAGEFTRCIFKNYDLSKLNITAISDKRFSQERIHEFYGLKCIKPQELPESGADVLLISTEKFVETYDMLTNTILKDCNTEIAPLIQTSLDSVLKGDLTDKICTRPFHTVSIVPTGHCITCCPAYIRNFVIGNIYRDDFESIWNGRRAKYLRKSLINGDYTICDLKTCINMALEDKKNLSEYFEGDSDDVKMPDTIYMGWDYDCNVACITCRNQIIKNDENTLNAYKAIEKSVLNACKNAKYFYTSGNGDPFGSSYARDIIKKVVEINPNIKFLIHTNGTLCNKKICDELNITDKMQTVTFSIHSACKETYDKIVRFGNFDNVIKNLEWISSLKKEGKLGGINLVFVVHKLNYKDMPDFVRLAEKYDAIASFRYYRQWSNNTEYNYNNMAVFEESHPEHSQFVSILQDKVFDSPNCSLDPSLRFIRENNK